MGKLHSNHWFIKDEFKWRSVASAFWTWMMAFPVLAGTVFVFTIHPSRHFLIVYDFLSIVSTIKSWVIGLVIATIASFLVCLHFQYHKVAPILPINRFQYVGKILKPNNLMHILISGWFLSSIAHLFTHLVPGRYSHTYYQCSDVSGNSTFCLNEFWFIFVFFGFIIGIANCVGSISTQRNSLAYLHVQEARFLFIKCKLPCIISNCAAKSWGYFRHFFVLYYFVGFVARDLVAVTLGVFTNETYLLSIWTIYEAIPVAWNLWLLGTFLLLTWELSWQLFNIYNTKNFPFLFDSVFPEDQPKLLLENLVESNPPAVQHLAFQCLSLIVRKNPTKRQQIFQLSHKTENGRPIWWNKILDNCLPRIQKLTESIVEYQTNSTTSPNMWQNDRKATSTSSENSNDSKSTSPASVSVYKRRDFNTSYQPDATNISCLNVSSLNETYTPSVSRVHNVTNIAVPTPRLWTSPNNTINNGNASISPGQIPAPFHVGAMRKRWSYFIHNVRTLPVVRYFFKPIPGWELENIYREHFIFKWSMQTLSYLCAASITEDRFGVVQGRLYEVISILIDLLVALEKLGKVSPSSTYVYKLHVGLRNEAKSSLHRIADAYGESLKSINLSAEHRRRLQGFFSYNE